jgi:type IV pilus assembly protein PilW
MLFMQIKIKKSGFSTDSLILNRRHGRVMGGGAMTGHTLIELFIAVTIGLLLISAVAGTFVWSSRNYRQDDSNAVMQDNARFAMETISKDLLMAGFMYDIINSTAISVHGNLDVSGDCGDWATTMSQLVTVISKGSASGIHGQHACVEEDDLYMTGPEGSEFTDTLAVKRAKLVSGTPVDGKIYLQTTIDGQARLVIYTGGVPKRYIGDPVPFNPAFADARTWEYVTSIYYVKKPESPGDPDANPPKLQPPLLYRKTLQPVSGTYPTVTTEAGGLAEGIEYFHIMWGIDHEMIDGNDATFPDGHPNYFVSSPTAAQVAGVVSAKIYVLARSQNFDATYTDDKQYQLGDVTLPPSGTYNDNYRRKVFSTSVRLRNQVIKNTALSLVSS